jgi:nuclear protein localization family protein 4
MKMAWTLNEFIAMDSQFVFKMARQEKSICSQVSLDSPSIADFQSYLQRFQFARKRFAFLYGTYQESDDDSKQKKVVVEAIYEPPQEPDSDAAEGFEQLEDPLEDKVRQASGIIK